MNITEQASGDTGGASDGRGLRRLVLMGAAFLLYEIVLIVAFGDYFYADVASTIGAWGMVAVASAGYFALGYFSRSWYSVVLLIVMLLVAVIIGRPGPIFATADGSTVTVHENPDLSSMWLMYSLVFVPAWAVGILVARNRGWSSRI